MLGLNSHQRQPRGARKERLVMRMWTLVMRCHPCITHQWRLRKIQAMPVARVVLAVIRPLLLVVCIQIWCFFKSKMRPFDTELFVLLMIYKTRIQGARPIVILEGEKMRRSLQEEQHQTPGHLSRKACRLCCVCFHSRLGLCSRILEL